MSQWAADSFSTKYSLLWKTCRIKIFTRNSCFLFSFLAGAANYSSVKQQINMILEGERKYKTHPSLKQVTKADRTNHLPKCLSVIIYRQEDSYALDVQISDRYRQLNTPPTFFEKQICDLLLQFKVR